MQRLAPYFTLDVIRRHTAEYLAEAHPSGSIPIPIDDIVERRHEIEIVPFPMLREKRGVDGFVSRDCKSIYVDSDLMKRPNPNRFRYTVAHELAHVVLHQRVFNKATFTDVNGWIGFIASVSSEDEKWIERQAYTMAGYLLVPQKAFELEYQGMAEQLEQKGIDIRTLTPQGLKRIAVVMGDKFQVSWNVIMWQGVHEGVWRPEDFPPGD